jgi:hypothetical protein
MRRLFAAAKDLVRIDCHNGSARRDGRWVVPRRIEVSGTVGSGIIRARPPRPPRRTFLQWLLHRPRRAELTS